MSARFGFASACQHGAGFARRLVSISAFPSPSFPPHRSFLPPHPSFPRKRESTTGPGYAVLRRSDLRSSPNFAATVLPRRCRRRGLLCVRGCFRRTILSLLL